MHVLRYARLKPAGFNRQLRERVAEVHLRVDRRQRVLPRRGQHLEERAVAIVLAVAIAGRPQVAGAQPRPYGARVQRWPGFERDAAGAMRAAVPVAGLRRDPGDEIELAGSPSATRARTSRRRSRS